jgi:hypothetical protein
MARPTWQVETCGLRRHKPTIPRRGSLLCDSRPIQGTLVGVSCARLQGVLHHSECYTPERKIMEMTDTSAHFQAEALGPLVQGRALL